MSAGCSPPMVASGELGFVESEFRRQRPVWVAHLKFDALPGGDLLARVLADQCGLWALSIILGLLLLAVEKYHRARVEVLNEYQQPFALDRSARNQQGNPGLYDGNALPANEQRRDPRTSAGGVGHHVEADYPIAVAGAIRGDVEPACSGDGCPSALTPGNNVDARCPATELKRLVGA